MKARRGCVFAYKPQLKSSPFFYSIPRHYHRCNSIAAWKPRGLQWRIRRPRLELLAEGLSWRLCAGLRRGAEPALQEGKDALLHVHTVLPSGTHTGTSTYQPTVCSQRHEADPEAMG